MKGNALFLRGLAFVYLCAFLSLFWQIPGLYSPDGLWPYASSLAAGGGGGGAADGGGWAISRALSQPGLATMASVLGVTPHFAADLLAGGGALLAALAAASPSFRGAAAYFALWLAYLSLYSAGAVFMQFQWDILLLEVGFVAVLQALATDPTGNTAVAPPVTWLLRFLLFKLMLMSGVVKLSSRCPTWENLTALEYHFATQCLPTPLAWFAHQLHPLLLRLSVGATIAIEVPLTLMLIAPVRQVRRAGAVAQLVLQALIFLSGNYNFFNLLTALLCLPVWQDDVYIVMPECAAAGGAPEAAEAAGAAGPAGPAGPAARKGEGSAEKARAGSAERARARPVAASAEKASAAAQSLLDGGGEGIARKSVSAPSSAVSSAKVPPAGSLAQAKGTPRGYQSASHSPPASAGEDAVALAIEEAALAVQEAELGRERAIEALAQSADLEASHAVSVAEAASADAMWVRQCFSVGAVKDIGLPIWLTYVLRRLETSKATAPLLRAAGAAMAPAALFLAVEVYDASGGGDYSVRLRPWLLWQELEGSLVRWLPLIVLCCWLGVALSALKHATMSATVTFGQLRNLSTCMEELRRKTRQLGGSPARFAGERRYKLRLVRRLICTALLPAAAAVLIFPLSAVPLVGLSGSWGRAWVPDGLLRLYAASNAYHISSGYGLFRRMTGVGAGGAVQRPEVVLEGLGEGGRWEEIPFLYKPGDARRMPGFVAPHQPRLDWQMWFAALGDYGQNPWLVSLAERLLAGCGPVERLLDYYRYPFKRAPPKALRAKLYHYDFADSGSGAWWRRSLAGDYLPPLDRENPSVEAFLRHHGLAGRACEHAALSEPELPLDAAYEHCEAYTGSGSTWAKLLCAATSVVRARGPHCAMMLLAAATFATVAAGRALCWRLASARRSKVRVQVGEPLAAKEKAS